MKTMKTKIATLCVLLASSTVFASGGKIKSEYDGEKAKIKSEYDRKNREKKEENRIRYERNRAQEVLDFITQKLGISSQDMEVEQSDESYLQDHVNIQDRVWVEFFYAANSQHVCKVNTYTKLYSDNPFLTRSFEGECLLKNKSL